MQGFSERSEPLSASDREQLRGRFHTALAIFFLLLLPLLTIFAYWLWIFFDSARRDPHGSGFVLLVVAFATLLWLFITGALLYWLRARYRFASLQHKTVYSGTVTDSWRRAGNASSLYSSHSRYVLRLGETDFDVDPDIQKFVPVGVQIELHCITPRREVLYHVELSAERRRAWEELLAQPRESLFRQIWSLILAFVFR